jgi:hypothetical protein
MRCGSADQLHESPLAKSIRRFGQETPLTAAYSLVLGIIPKEEQVIAAGMGRQTQPLGFLPKNANSIISVENSDATGLWHSVPVT